MASETEPASSEPSSGARPGLFRTTHWSVVLAAKGGPSADAEAALATLCQEYWYPLYCCVRRHGHPPEDAQDLTQAFFAKLLEKGQFALADPHRGRFRTFLLRSLENFLRTRHRDARAQKRGGGREIVSWDAQTAEERYAAGPADALSPATLYEREWAGALLEGALRRLEAEFALRGREGLFQALEPHLWGDETSVRHADIAAQLGMTVVAVRVTLHRLRQRFHELLLEAIADTVADPAEAEDELRHLRRILVGGGNEAPLSG